MVRSRERERERERERGRDRVLTTVSLFVKFVDLLFLMMKKIRKLILIHIMIYL